MKDLDQMELPTLESSQGECHAKTSASQVKEQESTENEADYGLTTSTVLLQFDPDSQSWKTFQLSLIEDYQTYSADWQRSGTMRLGQSTIPSTSDTRSVGAEFIFSLSEMESPDTPIFSDLKNVVLEHVSSRWKLSTRAVNGILRRAKESNIPLPISLANALMSMRVQVLAAHSQSETTNHIQT